jgi:hypothetical protein
MSRLVSLFSWNRNEPFTFALLQKTFLSQPVRGSAQQGFATAKKHGVETKPGQRASRSAGGGYTSDRLVRNERVS